ncbi:hypothetical protein JG687_00001720, partial [Phytophthora cactorum]
GDCQPFRRRCSLQGRVGVAGKSRLDLQVTIKQVFRLSVQVRSSWRTARWQREDGYLPGELAVL